MSRIGSRLSALTCAFMMSAPVLAETQVAIVEEVKGNVPGVAFMDYVSVGKVIKLGAKDSIVLGYMTSCWRESIAGSGIVVVGEEQSMVHLAKVERSKIQCDAGPLRLGGREANQSAATVLRSMGPEQQKSGEPRAPNVVYGVSPVVEVGGPGTLVVQRVDQPGDRLVMKLEAKTLVRGKFFDFARAGRKLVPGGVYDASFGSAKTTFQVAPQAQAGSTPLIGRLVRIE
jgi:hypothetical protein